MSMEEPTKRNSRPQLVKLDKALKLAEQWVGNMTKSSAEASNEVDLEGRPARLGLGATVPRQCKFVPSNDPVEMNLHAKLGVGKRKAAKNTEETRPSAGERHDGKVNEDEDEDENLDSRTNTFAKKRGVPLTTSSLQAKKKQK